jgi:hypothetical protein
MNRGLAPGFKLVLICMLILWASAVSLASRTITVCPSGCDYSSIQRAIDAAEPGDKISVEVTGSPYHEASAFEPGPMVRLNLQGGEQR